MFFLRGCAARRYQSCDGWGAMDLDDDFVSGGMNGLYEHATSAIRK
jgi:hypothetical protein